MVSTQFCLHVLGKSAVLSGIAEHVVFFFIQTTLSSSLAVNLAQNLPCLFFSRVLCSAQSYYNKKHE